MGWTSFNAWHYKTKNHRTVVDVKAECDDICNGEFFRVLKSSMVGSTYYAAIERCREGKYNEEKHCYEMIEDIPEDKREVFAVIFLTSVDNSKYYNFSYKDMDESYGPGECKCPMSILKLLTPTENKNALAWRKRCRDYAEFKRSKNNPSNLPVGTKIKCTIRGEERILEKMPPAYQFKKDWWYDRKKHQYVSKKRLPEVFEIIREEP